MKASIWLYSLKLQLGDSAGIGSKPQRAVEGQAKFLRILNPSRSLLAGSKSRVKPGLLSGIESSRSGRR